MKKKKKKKKKTMRKDVWGNFFFLLGIAEEDDEDGRITGHDSQIGKIATVNNARREHRAGNNKSHKNAQPGYLVFEVRQEEDGADEEQAEADVDDDLLYALDGFFGVYHDRYDAFFFFLEKGGMGVRWGGWKKKKGCGGGCVCSLS